MSSPGIALSETPRQSRSPSNPPWSLFGSEPFRAAYEYLSLQFMALHDLPRGDGHPVVIFPGLATDHRMTAPLKDFCERLGYIAYDWGKGLNTGPGGDGDAWIAELADHVRRLVDHHDRRMTLIGWSLGGIYAREVAKILDGEVRQVITLGTPFAGTDRTNVGWIYRLLNRGHADIGEDLDTRLRSAPRVPTTSIYSRSDGIVAWQSCLQDNGVAHAENIEVDGSHCGLCWNPAVLSIIAERLAQPEGRWQPRVATRSGGRNV